MSFDYFVGVLHCPKCGAVSPADSSTNMQTKIRATPDGSYLGVGDILEMRKNGPQSGGYLLLKEPHPSEAIHLLESWECPACGQPFNWAEVVIEQGILKAITPIALTREAIDRAHFISDQLRYVYDMITGQPLYEGTRLRPDFVQLLWERLPE